MTVAAMQLSAGRALALALSGASLLALSGCGGGGSSGGGGVISTPTPTPDPSPTPDPTPTPSPTPASSFNTQEYRDSDGPAQHDAISAWQDGHTGDGVAIAIIDTGIDIDSPEFAGRISGASADVAGDRTIESEDGHGTQVALVAAAARNGSGIMGIAFDATIVAVRTDEPGTCATFDPTDATTGCSFRDADIAEGVDLAVAAGAKVVNLSLGGSAPTFELTAAIQRAAAAGLVIVVSAGNEGESTDPGIDPDNPDPFAIGLLQAAPGNVIIVGSVDAAGTISGFSNRAGNFGESYLTARGEDVCCVYENGEIFVEVDGGVEYIYVVNGTSFSAPQVAGAAALLAQAFPNLTGSEIVELLLDGARDVGAAGTDAIYGRGVLDIAGAFAPSGRTALAGTETQVVLGAGTGVTSPAMGDAARKAALGTVFLDEYDRAYGLDLGGSIASARVAPKLHGAVTGRTQGLVLTAGKASLAFTVAPGSVRAAGAVPLRIDDNGAERAQLLAARIVMQVAPATQFAFALKQGAQGLEAGLAGQSRPAFLIAGEGGNDMGFVARRDGAVAVRHELGDFGLTASVETGDVWSDPVDRAISSRGEIDPFVRYAATLDWSGRSVAAKLGASWLAEDRTVLGARFGETLGAGGADSLFLDAALGWRPAPGWSLSADYRHGLTRADAGGLIASGSRLQSSAWSIDVERAGVFTPDGALGLRVSQPLRVESGGLSLWLPVGYDYASETAAFGARSLSLSPSGREIDGELRWHGPLWGGHLSTSLFLRRQPGNIAAMPADKGAAVRWSAKF